MAENNDLLKQRWRSKGFLLPISEASKKREFEFSLFGRFFMGELTTAPSGYWDDYMNSGSVHTVGLAIRKCRILTEEDEIISFNQIIFMRWAFSLGVLKEESND